MRAVRIFLIAMVILIVANMTRNVALIAHTLVKHGVVVMVINAEYILIVNKPFYAVKKMVYLIKYVKINLQLDVAI